MPVKNIIYTSDTFVYGTELDDVVHLTDPGAHIVELWLGNDTLFGNAGTENADGEEGNDRLYGRGGDDILNGGADNDLVYGGTGNDYVQGDLGADKVYGGAGDDIVEGGIDTVQTQVAWGPAEALNDEMYGGDGNDLVIADIWGVGGGNKMWGDAGNDTLILYDFETPGAPKTAGNMMYGGYGNDLLIATGQGDDLIDGGSGHDTLDYNSSDPYQSADAKVTVNLGLTGPQDVGVYGIDTIRNIENVTGTVGDDVITGSSSANILIGLLGDDTINGAGGSDSVYGGNGLDKLGGDGGNDLLAGGRADDLLSGGRGADTFVFEAIWDYNRLLQRYVNNAGVDTVTDFSRAQGDHIQMAAGTTFIGGAAFNALGAAEVRVDVAGTTQTLSYDVNGDGVTDGTLLVQSSTALAASDFLFI